MINDLLSLLLPSKCITCERILIQGEQFYCLHCRNSLQHPPPAYVLEAFNRKFSFMLNYYYIHWRFIEGGIAQRLIHAIKYQGRSDLCFSLGVEIGRNLSYYPKATLVPVPQHFFRSYRRGFNQAHMLALGISSVTGLPVYRNLLMRTGNSKSQVSRGRLKRQMALQGSIRINQAYKRLENIAIVDDVVTTGATIQSCGESILREHGDCNISIIALATV